MSTHSGDEVLKNSLGSTLQVDINSLAFSCGDWRRKAGAEGSTGRQINRADRFQKAQTHIQVLLFHCCFNVEIWLSPPSRPVHSFLWIDTRGFAGSLQSFISKQCFWSAALQKTVHCSFTYIHHGVQTDRHRGLGHKSKINYYEKVKAGEHNAVIISRYNLFNCCVGLYCRGLGQFWIRYAFLLTSSSLSWQCML